MLESGLVHESDKRVDLTLDDERRSYYQLTGMGAQTLAAELKRYRQIVTVAQARKLLPESFA